MSQEVHNFARFYNLLKRMPGNTDPDGLKRSLVLQHTEGRTESLREMTRKEYEACCASMEEATGYRSRLRMERSIALKLMTQIGVDTVSWDRVDAFCKDPRIAGKPFACLTPEELDALQQKLRAIKRKGGLRESPAHGAEAVTGMFLLRGSDLTQLN